MPPIRLNAVAIKKIFRISQIVYKNVNWRNGTSKWKITPSHSLASDEDALMFN